VTKPSYNFGGFSRLFLFWGDVDLGQEATDSISGSNLI